MDRGAEATSPRRTCIDSSVRFANFHHQQCTKETERKYAKQGADELDKCPSTMKYIYHDHPKATADQWSLQLLRQRTKLAMREGPEEVYKDISDREH